MNTAQSLHEDRRVRADDVFERIQLPARVEDHEGWETWQNFGKENDVNVWNKVVYLENENNPEGDTTKHVFEVVFRANTCIPVAAYLDETSLPLPR